jgi:RND family efflux transporter MFP subunit
MTGFRDRLATTVRRHPTLTRVVLPLVVLAAGTGTTLLLIAMREEVEMGEPEARAYPVEVVEVERRDRDVIVHATGRVQASRSVRLEPQVGGRVQWISPGLRPGGRFREGEVLLRIDRRDYQVAVQQQEAAVQQAQVRLQQERGRKEIAEREWRLFDSIDTSERGRSLALREPQLKEAEAGLEAARAALRQANLNLERTTISAPFDLVLQEENVDVGQIVRPGAPVAHVAGYRRFWVAASVPLDELSWLRVPGSEARIAVELSRDRWVVRRGEAVDILPAVQTGGMMAQVLVAVDDPLGEELEDESVPLLLGTVANVEIRGTRADSVYALPRASLRRDDSVWVVSDSATLEVRTVDVVHRTPDSLLVRGNLGEGPRIVTSMLATPLEGMKLEVREGGGG